MKVAFEREAGSLEIYTFALLYKDGRSTETFTNSEGQFTFKSLQEGDYLVETSETDEFEATSTTASVFPRDRLNPTPTIVMVMIDLPLKSAKRLNPAVITADVDLRVPKEALKHYRAGVEALESGDTTRAVSELQAAIAIYPEYYAARLELGRELRLQKICRSRKSAPTTRKDRAHEV